MKGRNRVHLPTPEGDRTRCGKVVTGLAIDTKAQSITCRSCAHGLIVLDRNFLVRGSCRASAKALEEILNTMIIELRDKCPDMARHCRRHQTRRSIELALQHVQRARKYLYPGGRGQ